MRPLIHQFVTTHPPESLLEQLDGEPDVMFLRGGRWDSSNDRYSLVAARPFMKFRSFGSRCEILSGPPGQPIPGAQVQFGNPWQLLDALLARCELLDQIDLPFPLGGCFGYWGYDLKNFVEPRLPRRAVNDLELPDCHVGFYDSLVVYDHLLGQTCLVSTGLQADGSRNEARAQEQVGFWKSKLTAAAAQPLRWQRSPFAPHPNPGLRAGNEAFTHPTLVDPCPVHPPFPLPGTGPDPVRSNLSRAQFVAKVERIQRYIFAGDLYQVNLSQRLTAPCPCSSGELFRRLRTVSPAPYSALLDCGDFQIVSSSPEEFLRLSGPHIQSRPIKGTRPRDADPARDAQLAQELQTSTKELAELVMITDLLRNDLGKVCEFGSVEVPELARLECFAQVQHLVSTVKGRLRNGVTHFAALASCFPGGSITGAPKIRAMEIIDELEPVSRGPYTGALGYLGFNRESQLSITIRTAICKNGWAHFNVGAGIVADSLPEAEYEETLAKAAGFLAALQPARNLATEVHPP